MWEDPREIHSVLVDFDAPIPPGFNVRLEYWGSRWPQQHLPKDREPGGGDNGWVELGNWYTGGWRTADSEQTVSGNSVRFTFRPINAHEFPDLKDYSSTGRFTLKLRVTGDQPLPKIRRLQAFTDSTPTNRTFSFDWSPAVNFNPAAGVEVTAFNGQVLSASSNAVTVCAVANPDPNTFDRTLVTLKIGRNPVTFRVDDLDDGPLLIRDYGVAIFPGPHPGSYAQEDLKSFRSGRKTLYDRISALPEQTWKSAWEGMPPKKSRICFILGVDGARQKFRLDSNGGLYIRWNDQFMKSLPGRDTARLAIEKAPVQMDFGLPKEPAERHLEDDCVPTCITTWNLDGTTVRETAFATLLNGLEPNAPPPRSDECIVAMVRFDFTNATDMPRTASLPVILSGGETFDGLKIDSTGLVWRGAQCRAQLVSSPGSPPTVSSNRLLWSVPLAAHGAASLTVKMPFLPLTESSETAALATLDFARERKGAGVYWRRVLDRSSRLITPEPILNQFYRAVPSHLLINSELDPGGKRRFARVGFLNYGVYGNESCMMILDLDRRGYHEEAAQCIEAWLHDQGTVGLPGDFDSKTGVLYGASGYESGGYNQHHGWILWTIAEHYRFTRDEAWLRRVSPNILAAADWIIHQTDRAAKEPLLPPGLLPPGDLEDIGDWWTWLSTSCYTWRGLAAAASALEQLHNSHTTRVRSAAESYHRNLVAQFTAASARSPVVRLRDGTAVPQIPSYAQRRGRSYGWICQTLEGPIHLIITGAIKPHDRYAEWILKDYEDNLFLSNQYGYTLDNFDRDWFGRGGMSMQACLLFDVEAYLDRDDIKQALRAMFNAIALNHFSDVHMNTEHALPEMGDWRGDHFKTSDEANACGWLRQLFLREEGDQLVIGKAVPRDWLAPGKQCGIENAATYFGNTSVIYTGEPGRITARLDGPARNPPTAIRLRFRVPGEKPFSTVTVNGRPWKKVDGDWVTLPGDIGAATVIATF